MIIGSIVFQCFHFSAMLEFWQQALHYVPREQPEADWAVLTDPKGLGPNLSLKKTMKLRKGKRSRLHLDLYAEDQAAEVKRLIALGASLYNWDYQPEDDFVVLADPDDNLFCVVSKARAA